MSKKALKTFVLHDSTVNTYGFRMLTEGADLDVFMSNPVMLLNHDDWGLPIGRWVNIRIEGDKILAEADFDLKDERAAEIARKVEEGYIKAASIGAWALTSTDDPALRLDGQTGATITKWQVREASICTIGANHNAIALYDKDDARIDLDDRSNVVRLMSSINQNNINMNKELLNLLNLQDTASEESVMEAVKVALSENDRLKKEMKTLSDELKRRREAEAEALKNEAVQLTDAAIRDGRIEASARDSMLALFDANHEAAKVMLSSTKVPEPIVPQLSPSVTLSDDLMKAKWDELDKHGKLQELKDKHPEVYKAKFKEEFGVEPQL